MNLAHLHLLLNHWPIIGTFIAVGLFLVALVAKSHDLKRFTLALFSLIGLLAIPTYVSGNLVQDIIQQEPGVSESLIAAHQGAALLALVALLITGGFAWAALWQLRRESSRANRTLAAVLVCSLVTV